MDIDAKRLSRTEALLIAAGMLAAVFAIFGRAIFYGFAPSDDLFLVVQNLAVRGPTLANLKTVFTSYDPELYIPFTFISYQIDYLIGGLHPAMYHITNMFLHAANAYLVAWLLLLLTGKKWFAVAAGALFAVHPLQTEAVVWIAGRKDLLSTFFCLLSFIFYIHARFALRYRYMLSVLFFLCALLSKVNVLTLPALLLLYDLLIEQRSCSWKNTLLDKLPYIALSVLFLIIALAGKERVIHELSAWEMLLLASKSTVFYLWKFIAPFGLTIIYPHNGPVLLKDFWPYLCGVVALGAVIVTSFRREPWLAFGLLFYSIALSPTFINDSKAGFVYFAVDRYAYFPLIGILFLLVHLLARWWPQERFHRVMSIAFVFVPLCALSVRQVNTWRDATTLYKHALDVYPESLPARVSLARINRQRGKIEDAFAILKDGLQYGDYAVTRMEVGYLYAKSGQVADARIQFTKAMEMDPTSAEPVFSLGSLEEQVGNTNAAMDYFTKAVALDPSYVIARVRLGSLLFNQGKKDEAKTQALEALRWNQNSVQAHELMSKILDAEGNTDAANAERALIQELKEGGQPFN